MPLEKFLDINEIPEEIKTAAPWLNEDYVRKNGYIPVSNVGHSQGEITLLGFIPYKSKKLVKQGDVIIFNEYSEEENDRLQIVDEDIYRMVVFENVSPVGIIAPRPEN